MMNSLFRALTGCYLIDVFIFLEIFDATLALSTAECFLFFDMVILFWTSFAYGSKLWTTSPVVYLMNFISGTIWVSKDFDELSRTLKVE